MGYETRWAVRVRVSHADGVATTIDPALVLCVKNFTINPRGKLTEVTTDCSPGTLFISGGIDFSWSFEMPRLTAEWSAATELLLCGGSMLSFEVCTNPFMADGVTPRATGLKIGVIYGTTIEESSGEKEALSAAMLKISGKGGQWYSYKLGSRVGFPAPFDTVGT